MSSRYSFWFWVYRRLQQVRVGSGPVSIRTSRTVPVIPVTSVYVVPSFARERRAGYASQTGPTPITRSASTGGFAVDGSMLALDELLVGGRDGRT